MGSNVHKTARLLLGTVLTALLIVQVGCSSQGDRSASASTSSSTTTPAPDVAPFATVDQAVAFGRPVVLAHAGGENAHPHSTMYAYEESVKEGVDILDFDVRLTRDNVLVVFHDDTVDRTTDGTGRVDQMTWRQLHELDAAYWFTETCSACEDAPEGDYVLRGIRTGEVDPPDGHQPGDFAPTRFEDVVERFPGFVLNVEIKGSYPESVPVAEELARILTRHDKVDSAIVTAFDDELAEAFHQLAPQVEITPGLAAMTRYVLNGEKLVEGRRILQIPPDYEGIEVLTADLVERAHDDGAVLWIWPNDREWENSSGYRKLLEMGVDGINAADPAVAVRTVAAFADD